MPEPIIRLMWPTGYALQRRVTGGSVMAPAGPAMMTLRSVIAGIASLVRSAGIIFTVIQVIIWHSFYTAAPWRLTAPVLAVAWAGAVTARIRRRWPSSLLACADSAAYVTLALSAQQCVPPAVRDNAFSWLFVSMSGHLIVPVWCAPGALALLLAAMSPAAYLAGAVLQPLADIRTLTAATVLLATIGLVHAYGRRTLFTHAALADEDVAGADRAASEQYATLSRNIERREHERLLHDTILNTLTALARSGGDDVPGTVNRCRQDVALIEDVLGGPGDLAAGAGHASGDLASEVGTVAAGLRARGLIVHVEFGETGVPAVPARVATALSNAVREALSNVAAHAGTGEAWVEIGVLAPEEGTGNPRRLQVTVRDQGAGFNPARVDPARLGLRRSIAERAADCGGRASVWSQPGQGTVVCLSWPAPAGPGSPAPVHRILAGHVRTGHALAQESAPW